METWTKRSYVCDVDVCDSLIEVTSKDSRPEFNVTNLTCLCGQEMRFVSVVPATILPITETKEDKMETLSPAKSATELLEEIQSLNTRLENVSRTRDMYATENLKLGNQISNLKDYLVENYDELELHADEIATIMDVPLSREVTYDVVINARVTVTVALGEDGEDIINDNLYVDANYGDLVVDDYSVDSVSTY